VTATIFFASGDRPGDRRGKRPRVPKAATIPTIGLRVHSCICMCEELRGTVIDIDTGSLVPKRSSHRRGGQKNRFVRTERKREFPAITATNRFRDRRGARDCRGVTLVASRLRLRCLLVPLPLTHSWEGLERLSTNSVDDLGQIMASRANGSRPVRTIRRVLPFAS
jgi:hypothetical protein